MDALSNAIKQFDFVGESKLEKDLLVLSLTKEIEAAEVNKILSEQGIYLSHIALKKRSLESYFLELLSEKNV